MSYLEKAITLAAKAHQGQKDRYGKIAILHPLRVMLQMKSEDGMIVAVLHDVVEKSQITLEQLQGEGFPEDVIRSIDAITRRAGEDYEEYIVRSASCPLSRQVKIADLEDNMDLMRCNGQLLPEDFQRFTRYHKAWMEIKQNR